jgi:hypothetical protein
VEIHKRGDILTALSVVRHLATRDNAKTPKKRPPQSGELIGVRIQPEPLAVIDAWRRKQEDLLSRAETIRRLVELGLSFKEPSKTKR